MKASELVKALLDFIEEHGDFPVVDHQQDWDKFCPIEGVFFREIKEDWGQDELGPCVVLLVKRIGE